MTALQTAQKKEYCTQKVVVSLTETNYLTRWPCHICGGLTEKVPILAEVKEGEFEGFRVCEQCIEERDFDTKLLKHAEELEAMATDLRSLVGRLEVPTFEQYEARYREHEEAFRRWHEKEEREQLAQSKVVTDTNCDSEFPF